MKALKSLNVDLMTRQPTPASSRIIEGTTINVGWFDKPFEYPEICFDKVCLSWRHKKWQYLSMTSDRYIIGMAVVDAGYLSNFFLFVFDFLTKKFIEFECKRPFGHGADIAKNSLSGTSSFESEKCKLKINNHFSEGYYLVSIDCKDQKNRLEGSVKVHTYGDPLVNIRPVAPKRLVYTHQSATYRPEGQIIFNNEIIRYNPEKDFSSFDYTQGHHLYNTSWNWASGGGYSTEGDLVAINFSSETGFFYWVNGCIYRIPDLVFQFVDIDGVWKLRAPDQTIEIDFSPIGKRRGNVNILGLLVSAYQQPFGSFVGNVITSEGRLFSLSRMLGVTEKHIARW